MKRGFLLALVAALAGVTALHAVGNLPRFRSSGDSPLSAEEKVAMKAWFMEQYQVRQHFGTDRVSIQRIGAQEEKNPDGTPFRRVVAHARNYTTGMVTRLTARLDDNSLAIDDIGYGAMQPTAEEQARAQAVIQADQRLRALAQDLTLKLEGGFVVTAADPTDPCHREMCMVYGFMEPSFSDKNRRMVIVNLSREQVVNTHYIAPAGSIRQRLTAEER
jgi:hypothetical protein